MEKKSHLDKKLARLAAVQAIFQAHHRQQTLMGVMKEFEQHDFSMVLDALAVSNLSQAFFKTLLVGLDQKIHEINEIITRHLSDDWTFERIDSVSRAILQVGLYELLYHPETPAIVVISEYSDMAHAFFDASDASFVNGLLNRVARSARPNDFDLLPENG